MKNLLLNLVLTALFFGVIPAGLIFGLAGICGTSGHMAVALNSLVSIIPAVFFLANVVSVTAMRMDCCTMNWRCRVRRESPLSSRPWNLVEALGGLVVGTSSLPCLVTMER